MTAAMDRLRDEMAAHHDDTMLCQLGELLSEYLRETPAAESAFAANGKTIAGAVEAMAKEARRKAKGNRAALTLPEGMQIALAYFGVEPDNGALTRVMISVLTGTPEGGPAATAPAAAQADELDLDALLGGVDA